MGFREIDLGGRAMLVNKAGFKVFLFGESDGFGLGVDFEEIWSVRVAREMAHRAGFSKEQTCIMNFAESGASNAYIARMLISQCAAVQPDLVLAHFAEDGRTELLEGDQGWNCGSWLESPALDTQIRDAINVTEERRGQLREVLNRGRAFLQFNNVHQGLYRSLLELLLVQEFTASRALQSICIGYDTQRFHTPLVLEDPRLGPLARRLSPAILRHFPLAKLLAESTGAFDEYHLSAEAHQQLAQLVLSERPDADRTTQTDGP